MYRAGNENSPLYVPSDTTDKIFQWKVEHLKNKKNSGRGRPPSPEGARIFSIFLNIQLCNETGNSTFLYMDDKYSSTTVPRSKKLGVLAIMIIINYTHNSASPRGLNIITIFDCCFESTYENSISEAEISYLYDNDPISTPHEMDHTSTWNSTSYCLLLNIIQSIVLKM